MERLAGKGGEIHLYYYYYIFMRLFDPTPEYYAISQWGLRIVFMLSFTNRSSRLANRRSDSGITHIGEPGGTERRQIRLSINLRAIFLRCPLLKSRSSSCTEETNALIISPSTTPAASMNSNHGNNAAHLRPCFDTNCPCCHNNL